MTTGIIDFWTDYIEIILTGNMDFWRDYIKIILIGNMDFWTDYSEIILTRWSQSRGCSSQVQYTRFTIHKLRGVLSSVKRRAVQKEIANYGT